TTYTTSKYFGFVTMSRHALDNITVDNEIIVFPDPADLKFKDESVSVSCKQNSSTTASIYVQNKGDVAGSATLVVGTTPDGITVTLDSTSITDLKLGTSQTVIATIEASSAITPGDYEVNLELRDGSTVLDTIKLIITILEASKPPPADDSPGFLVIGVIFAIGTVLIYRRKEKM
ncbi:MAG: NEW3 domain-containing protein, partial [Candidatus Hermodarchaeota archaeon]